MGAISIGHSDHRIVLINFYFGSFPNYFSFFLKSCSYNPHIIWWIFTDQKQEGIWPDNVIYHHMTFGECRDLFQSRFSYPISLKTPKKLCDYKPLYGYILKEQLRNFDFWGCCDLDLIYGRIEMEEHLLRDYDKVYTLGHFTLYRNTPECSEYLLRYDNGARLREVLTTPYMVAFDEWGPGNANDIYARSKVPFYQETIGADIWPANDIFKRSVYRADSNRYQALVGTEGILHWKDGNLSYIYKDGRVEDVSYAHLQKRTFEIKCHEETDDYYILPGAFVEADASLTEILDRATRPHLLDRQWLKIKRISIVNRLKRFLRKKQENR